MLFTSNWEKTLGRDPQGATGEKARQDVFLIQLPGVADDNDTTPDATPAKKTGSKSAANVASGVTVDGGGR